MVHEIVKSKYRIFVESLFFTFIILLIGFMLGFLVEYGRSNEIIKDYKEFEVRLLDLRLQNYYYQTMDAQFCERAIKQNLVFADDIYEKGLLIQKYEDVNELSNDILLEKKKYVLLKTELWLNSVLLKQKCGEPFHTVVYIYSQTDDLIKEAEQKSISDTLGLLKEKYGNEIILIPIAGDIGLDVVSIQTDVYNITYFPSVLIDEEHLLESYHPIEDFEKYLN